VLKISQNKSYIEVINSENYFNYLAKTLNLTIIGSFDPGKIKLSNEDFHDGMHSTRYSMWKIISYQRNNKKSIILRNK